jgi:uroporphyrinogen-III decarboxylase
MMMMVDEPELAHRLLELLTAVVIDFALYQTELGGEMIGAGDAAASLVSPAMYREFALPYEQRVCEAVHAGGGLVKLHICGNTTGHLKDMTRSGADLCNVDHLVDFSLAADVYGDAALCFKGNLDPVAEMLQATPEECEARAVERLRAAEGMMFMLSAGCEVPTGCTDDVFRAFCEAPATYEERRVGGI